jgi:hypothetical protein
VRLERSLDGAVLRSETSITRPDDGEIVLHDSTDLAEVRSLAESVSSFLELPLEAESSAII